MSFYVAWFLSALALIVIATLVGYAAKDNLLGLLIDERDRFSLNHLQITMWTILVLSTLGAVFISNGFDAAGLAIPRELLILMGISVGSAVGAGAVKSSKDADGSGARVARHGKIELTNEGVQRYQAALRAKAPPSAQSAPSTQSVPNSRPTPQRVAQMFLEEEGDQADEVTSITKFQNLVFTLVTGTAYVVLVAKTQFYPELPEEVLWLIGISHAGYLGGKIPNKQ